MFSGDIKHFARRTNANSWLYNNSYLRTGKLQHWKLRLHEERL